ncbi:MAG: 6,7-dimethyl-8-ribityllumazine synthase [Paracoccus sp. (in: a-proteobacteria)]|nr:6,7-dimethyl-8-ribityllumazine synthase [Paracoccus sp. (in: a-proteobacteria)]
MAGPQHDQITLPRFEAPPRLLLVVAPYYRQIADLLIAGAREAAEAAGAITDLVEVPGALELPPAIAMAARSGRYDGFVALGCVIRGETTHYETVCNESARGLMALGLDGTAIGNGILTVENEAQAITRADPAQQNKGGGAAEAALHLIALSRKFRPAGFGAGTRAPAGKDDPIRLAGRLEGGDQA